MMKIRFITMILVIMVTSLLLIGCSGENNPVKTGAQSIQTAPDLPSSATMKIDIPLFHDVQIAQKAIQSGNIEEGTPLYLSAAHKTKLNFLNAAVRVLYLEVVAYSSMVVPVAAFEAAINSIPQPVEDGSWLWTYLYVGKDGEYSVYLYGKPETDYVQWRMEVSSTDPDNLVDHFVWFDGRVYDDGNYGYWQFYEVVTSSPEFRIAGYDKAGTPGIESVRIDWEDNCDGTSQLVFLINKPGSPSEGSTLSFSESPQVCSIQYYDSVEDETGNIVYYQDGSGYIEWPDYNRGIRGCWDYMQFDTECPE